MGFIGWNIGVSPSFCRAHNQVVTCDFNGPIKPLQLDTDLVTKAWWGAFLTTAWTTAIVSIALITLESLTWSKKRRHITELADLNHHDWVRRCMRVMERLINAFSEQQTITSLSLIVVAGHNGCQISAYTYNLVCFFVVMSLITHLNALTNTENWFADPTQTFKRGIINGVVKITPILVTIVLAGMMLGARVGGHFPVFAGKAATFKAACYENTSKSAIVDFAAHGLDWASNGFIQYMILAIDLLVVAVIFAIALLKKIHKRPQGFRAGLSLILRWISTAATTGTLIWLSVQYINMRKTMEGNPDWYHKDDQNQQYSFFNIVQWALFASSIYSFVNALADAYKVRDIVAGELAAEKAAYTFQQLNDNLSKLDSGDAQSPDIST